MAFTSPVRDVVEVATPTTAAQSDDPVEPLPTKAKAVEADADDDAVASAKARAIDLIFQSPPQVSFMASGIASALSPQAAPSESPKRQRTRKPNSSWASDAKENAIGQQEESMSLNSTRKPSKAVTKNTEVAVLPMIHSPPMLAAAPSRLPGQMTTEGAVLPMIPSHGLSGAGAVIAAQPAWVQWLAKAFLCVCLPVASEGIQDGPWLESNDEPVIASA